MVGTMPAGRESLTQFVSFCMHIKSEELIKIATLLDLIPLKSGIPCSEYIRVTQEKDKLVWSLSSDLAGRFEIVTAEKWPVASPYFLDRSLFMPFVFAAKNMKSKIEFDLSAEKDALLMKHGRRKVLFSKVTEVTGYGKIETDGKAIEVSINDEQKEILRCAESCAASISFPELNCVFTTENGLVLSSNRVIIFSAKTEKFKQSIPMPLELLKMLDVGGINKILFAPKFIMFKMDCGEIVQAISQKASKEFPVKVITDRVGESANYKQRFAVPAKRMHKVLERFASYMPVKSESKVIQVSMAAGDPDIKISAVVGQAHLSESIKSDSPSNGVFKMDWLLDLVLPVIKFLAEKGEEVTVSAESKTTPYLISGSNVSVLLARKIS